MAFNFFQKFIGRRVQKQDDLGAKKTTALHESLQNTRKEESSPAKHSENAVDRAIVAKGKNEYASKIALFPHISEKATMFQESKDKEIFGLKYVFRVANVSNKNLIKKALEDRYGVKVQNVRVLNTYGRTRRRGKVIGFQAGYKKALVTLQKGFSIEEL